MTSSPTEASSPAPPRGFRVGLFLLAALLLLLLIELLTHRSTNPRILGLWSPLYAAILLLHAAAAAACVGFALRPQRHAAALRFLRSPATCFWWGLALLLCIYLASVYLRSGENDFKNLAVLLLDLALLAWLAAAWHAPRVRRPLMLAMLLAGGLLVPLLAIELLLALFPSLAPGLTTYRLQQITEQRDRLINHRASEAYQSLQETDPVLGFKALPNAKAQVDYIVGEGGKPEKTFLETDAWGFFNPDLDPSRPYDVAVVGDSYVMSPWTGVMARETGLRVANLGRARYCPPQYTEVVKRYALKLRPRVILYCLYLNDASESDDYLNWLASGQDWFTHKGGYWFGIRDARPGRAILRHDLTRVSHLYSLPGLMAFKARLKAEGVVADKLEYRRDQIKLNFDPNSYTALSDPARPDVQRGLAQIRASLAQAADLCTSAGVQLVVVLMPCKELVYDQAVAEVAPPGAPLGNIAALYQAYRTMAETLGLQVFDLAPNFRQAAAASAEPLYWQDDTHWNPRGTELMAHEGAAILHQLGLAPPPSATPAP